MGKNSDIHIKLRMPRCIYPKVSQRRSSRRRMDISHAFYLPALPLLFLRLVLAWKISPKTHPSQKAQSTIPILPNPIFHCNLTSEYHHSPNLTIKSSLYQRAPPPGACPQNLQSTQSIRSNPEIGGSTNLVHHRQLAEAGICSTKVSIERAAKYRNPPVAGVGSSTSLQEGMNGGFDRASESNNRGSPCQET